MAANETRYGESADVDQPDDIPDHVKQQYNPEALAKFFASLPGAQQQAAEEQEGEPKVAGPFHGIPLKPDDTPEHVLTADPPDRFPNELPFSEWLRSNPHHEDDQQFEFLRQLGVKDTHTPSNPYDEDDDGDSAPPARDDRPEPTRRLGQGRPPA